MSNWQGNRSKVRVNAIPALLRGGLLCCWVTCSFLPSSFPQIKSNYPRLRVLKKGDPHFTEMQIFKPFSVAGLNSNLSCCCREEENCTAHLVLSLRVHGAELSWEDLSTSNPAERGSSCCPSRAGISLDETWRAGSSVGACWGWGSPGRTVLPCLKPPHPTSSSPSPARGGSS